MSAGNPARSEKSEKSERDFLASYDVSDFEQLSLAVDVAVLSLGGGALRAALLRRGEHPHKGRWALPGGFVGLEESVDGAARRVLRGKAGLRDVFLEQLYTFGSPRRDPRTRVVSVAYIALVAPGRLEAAGLEAFPLHVPWAGEVGGDVAALGDDGTPLRLAFDHASILGMAVKRLRGKLAYTPIGFQLLPAEFTLRQLQEVHETVLGHRLNKDSFRRRMLAGSELEATGEREDEVGHRPAELYRFVRRSAI